MAQRWPESALVSPAVRQRGLGQEQGELLPHLVRMVSASVDRCVIVMQVLLNKPSILRPNHLKENDTQCEMNAYISGRFIGSSFVSSSFEHFSILRCSSCVL